MRRAHLVPAFALATALPILCLHQLSCCSLSFATADAEPGLGPTSMPQQQPPTSLRAGPGPGVQARRPPAPNNPDGGSDSSFDYIVVGAGNAGAVVAARLSEDPGVRVLLLEEGTFSQDSQGQGQCSDWVVDQISTPRHDYRTWAIHALTQQIYTEANPALNNRSGILLGPVVTGKALGGSTVVNIGAYTRPGPDYFDRWGLENWSGEEVVRYFRKLEDHEDPRAEYGKGGPLHVEHGDAQTIYPYLHQASLSMDPPLQTNSAGRLSYGLPQVYRVLKEGRRVDAYTAYLRPALGRPNLVIRTGARVEQVVFDDKKRAVGVEYSVVKDGGEERVQFGQQGQQQKDQVDILLLARARHEVTLCAGVFFTPHILLKSGVGPKDHLEAAGIPVVADLPGVGRNLLARINVVFFYGNGSVVPEMDPFVLRDEGTTSLYQEQHRGPYSLGSLGIYTVVKGRFPAEKDYVMFMTDVIPEVAPRMFALGCSNLRVHAPGRVELKLEDPVGARHPRIHLNMIASDEDRNAVRQCLRDVRDLMAEPAMVSRGFKEAFPTRALVDNTDAALDRWIRTGFSFFSWHATGTAKMAAGGDPLGVLDERLRVRGGVTGLRVADASAVPDMIEAGPMATLYMVGERVADLIKEDYQRRGQEEDEDGEGW